MGGNISSASSFLDKEHLEPQILNSYQKVILRSTWRHMSKNGQSGCGHTIMRRLFIRDDRIKKVFQHHSVIDGMLNESVCPSQGIQKHFNEIVQLLHFVICNLDHPSKISEACQLVGVQHRKYKGIGIKTEHWDLLGEAITETIREFQGWKRHRESLRAANILVSYIVDQIRTGFLLRDASSSEDSYPWQNGQQNDSTTGLERSRSLHDSTRSPGGSICRHRSAGRISSCPINRTSSLGHAPQLTQSGRTSRADTSPRSSTDQQLTPRQRRILPKTPSALLLEAPQSAHETQLSPRFHQFSPLPSPKRLSQISLPLIVS